MPRKSSSAPNALVQATVFKKCDRSYHRPDSNKGCAAGTCQHTGERAQVSDRPHQWTARYSVAVGRMPHGTIPTTRRPYGS
jgi:hypothetical protein